MPLFSNNKSIITIDSSDRAIFITIWHAALIAPQLNRASGSRTNLILVSLHFLCNLLISCYFFFHKWISEHLSSPTRGKSCLCVYSPKSHQPPYKFRYRSAFKKRFPDTVRLLMCRSTPRTDELFISNYNRRFLTFFVNYIMFTC